MNDPRNPLEHDEQCALHDYLTLRSIPHTAIPNANAFSFLNRIVAIKITNKLKAEGMSKGFPDLVIFLPHKLLIIEMKRKKGSETSTEQREWIKTLNRYKYIEAIICKGADEAIAKIEQELK